MNGCEILEIMAFDITMANKIKLALQEHFAPNEALSSFFSLRGYVDSLLEIYSADYTPQRERRNFILIGAGASHGYAMATIALHGIKKAQAIKMADDFIERQKPVTNVEYIVRHSLEQELEMMQLASKKAIAALSDNRPFYVRAGDRGGSKNKKNRKW